VSWRRSGAGLLGFLPLLAAGCATGAAGRLQTEVYWDAAVECEARYRTLHLDRVDSDGTVAMHADAESRQDLYPFIACYQKAVQARVERRRQAGLPVPEGFNEHPTAELD
jgi:hypothetical protein